jgi:hypothetical protein
MINHSRKNYEKARFETLNKWFKNYDAKEKEKRAKRKGFKSGENNINNVRIEKIFNENMKKRVKEKGFFDIK